MDNDILTAMVDCIYVLSSVSIMDNDILTAMVDCIYALSSIFITRLSEITIDDYI